MCSFFLTILEKADCRYNMAVPVYQREVQQVVIGWSLFASVYMPKLLGNVKKMFIVWFSTRLFMLLFAVGPNSYQIVTSKDVYELWLCCWNNTSYVVFMAYVNYVHWPIHPPVFLPLQTLLVLNLHHLTPSFAEVIINKATRGRLLTITCHEHELHARSNYIVVFRWGAAVHQRDVE